jgi:AAHS family 4-hydroxybenzoate transporter-like MFS transporter
VQQRPSKPIDVEDFLNAQPFSSFHWLVFALCVAVVLLDGFDTAAIGYIAPSLVADWGVAKPDLAPVLSAALLGLAGGALSAGPLADRFGRKGVLIAAIGAMGAASLAGASSGDLRALTAWRFLTGLGLGAAMPNAVTLMTEYCPFRARALITNAMFCGFPLGQALAGFVAAWIIPTFGWRSVLIVGGVAPLALAAASLSALPESARFMVTRGYAAERIRVVLTRLSQAIPDAASFVLREREPFEAGAEQSGLGLILSPRFLVGTAMLWLAYFMGLVIVYGLLNWMPLLLKESGLPAPQATLVSALFPLGGFGAIALGWLMDRWNANAVVAVGFFLTAIAVGLVGQAAGGWLVLAVFAAGVATNTSQTSLPSLAAAFYPTRARATGVAWMMGVGRFGGIAGSYFVADLTRRQLGLGDVFLLVAMPALVAVAAILVKQVAHPPAREPVVQDLLAH